MSNTETTWVGDIAVTHAPAAVFVQQGDQTIRLDKALIGQFLGAVIDQDQARRSEVRAVHEAAL